MASPSPRAWQLFLELYEGLPRQGPGDRTSAARALALCQGLPANPRALDLGCGVGGQTLHLAALTGGRVAALNLNPGSIRRLRRTAEAAGIAGRLWPLVGDMGAPPFRPATFDLVWSEGALYNLGIPPALACCRDLLRPGGWLAFTDAVWRRPDPPAEILASFRADYPAMGRAEDVAAAIAAAGLQLHGRFTLPDEAWWDDFYTPMEARIQALRAAHAGDAEALAVLEVLAREPELHRRYGAWYAYEFFVARRA